MTRDPGRRGRGPAAPRAPQAGPDAAVQAWGVEGVTVGTGSALLLDDVTLAVPRGQVTAVVGGDGAGKSTLLGVLVGSRVPDAGTVRAPGRGHVGFMPATSGVWGDLSVAENVDLVARAYGLDRALAAARAEELLGAAGLLGVTARLGRQLSGGMCQKLGFCLALLHEPPLVVLDEPSTGVDPVSRVELWRMMSRAAASGTAVLLATTYLDEAERAATLLVLDRGAALFTGDPVELPARVRGTVTVSAARPPEVPSWRRGADFHALLAPGAVPPAGARVVTPDVEDAVIALTLERAAGGRAPARNDPAPVRTDAPVVPAGAGVSPVVDVRRVVTRFGDLRAVDDVSLTVRPGEIVGLLGANGAGKTTLIRTVLGLLAPSEGHVEVFGAPPSRASRRRLGYVPQGLGLSADLSVAENVEFVTGAYGVDGQVALPPGLAGAGDRTVRTLGLGLRRQLAFAVALAHDPDLLVLDEPTSGVDPLARAALWDTVRARAQAGAAVLVTTHYMQEAEQCDVLVLMSQGTRVAAGTLAEVLGSTTALEVEGESWAEVFGVLTAAGLPVTVAGRSVRVAGAAERDVRAALTAAGVVAQVREVPANLEEVMTLTEG